MQNLCHTFASTAGQIRNAVQEQREFIERALAVRLDEAVILDGDRELFQPAIAQLLQYSDPNASVEPQIASFIREVSGVELPDGYVPLLEIRKKRAAHAKYSLATATDTTFAYSVRWMDGPVLLKLRPLSSPIVAMTVCHHAGPESQLESQQQIVIVPRHGLQDFLKLMKRVTRPVSEHRLTVWDGETRTVAPGNWDDLVLDPEVVRLVKDDFEFFWGHEEEFRNLRLPFRRGYLLHGNPGCGKSSVARCLMTSRCLTAYTLRFFDSHTDDDDLERMFHHAAEHAPSMILLEDIDRIFPKGDSSKSNISLQQMLNCLDGVGSGEGIIVVATANDATCIEPALLKRPGRFDRVVSFPNPDSKLRRQYYAKMIPGLSERDLVAVSEECDGFSFAQLRESFIMAMQTAMGESRKVNVHDLTESIDAVRRAVLFGSLRAAGPGFAAMGKP